MMCDLINGMLSKDVMRRLRRARLVALPKTAQAVRPVAMGEIFLKLAGLILLLRNEHKFEKLFLPMQHGVMSRAGCETIVHELNRRYMEGCAILSLDMKNAFNSPSRDEIAKAIFAFSALRPFQRLFVAEYGAASELLFYGKNGELFSTVESSAGVRQGSPLSTLYFCSFLQPILETIALRQQATLRQQSNRNRRRRPFPPEETARDSAQQNMKDGKALLDRSNGTFWLGPCSAI